MRTFFGIVPIACAVLFCVGTVLGSDLRVREQLLPALRLIMVQGLEPHGRFVEIYVPHGMPERVVLYFPGNNTEEANGFWRKTDQIREQFIGHNVAVITPDLGFTPSRSKGIFLTKSGKPNVDVLTPAYDDIRTDLGVDMSNMPLVALCFSGGCVHMREFLQSGAAREQLEKPGGAIVFLGGQFGDLAPIIKTYDAPFVSISTGSDTPINNQRLADALSVQPIENLDDVTELKRGDRLIVKVPRRGIHATLPASGYIQRVMDLTALRH